MVLRLPRPAFFVVAAAGFLAAAGAEPLSLTVAPVSPPPPLAAMGASVRPDGSTLGLDGASLLLDGRPWMPAMGEFHYARYPESGWRDELLKMKAGGISIVSTYVFWIYHEEVEGEWDWTGRRNLREFLQQADSVGLKVIVRCGPWSHGEVRNGGLPDWLVAKGWEVRSLDPRFLGEVSGLYAQIAAQMRGLLWKDGGPVIGVQVDNEYGGPAAYLLELKRMVRAAGIDVPIYTRTGWPQLQTPMPFGEMVPLYGVYAEGFWDRELTSMPGQYWTGFRFSTRRIDENIANDELGRRAAQEPAGLARYPYLTCEIGGGMMTSYHRRILIQPLDVESTVLVKLGSGSTLPGYYMYQGGDNPAGRRTTLMEAQNTPMTNLNDLPVETYDFQAPLGEFGQLRPQYHWLRRLHLFLADFGPALARMPAVLPDRRPRGPDDVTTLRWAVRSDGSAGYVFVNNYERSRLLPAKPGVQFAVTLPSGPMIFPQQPVTIPPASCFFWPFNFELGHGVRLAYATAQPICAVDDGPVRTVFFAETPGVAAEFALAGEAAVRRLQPGHGPGLTRTGSDGGRVRVVLLSEADSLELWKGAWRGRERVFLTRAGLMFDGGAVRLSSGDPAALQVEVDPAPAGLAGRAADGVFERFAPAAPRPVSPVATVELLRHAGPAREIPLGRIAQPVAAEPTDADFAAAAVWRVRLPADLDLSTDPILRVRYAGDVARLVLDGRLLDDNFYNGNAFDLGLRRYAPAILRGDLRIAILPLRRDAVAPGPGRRIFLAAAAQPDFRGADSVAQLQGVEIIPRYEARLDGAGAPPSDR